MCSICSQILWEYMNISSRYMCMNIPRKSRNIAVINCWNVEGALQSPICITRLWNVPNIVENVVFLTSSGLMRVCSKASVISNLDLNLAHAISWCIASWSGKGVMSFHVFSFCCHRSNTVLNVLFLFGIHSIGVACFVAAGTHLPAVVYHLIFQVSSEQNTSGHVRYCISYY